MAEHEYENSFDAENYMYVHFYEVKEQYEFFRWRFQQWLKRTHQR
jgi:hypothetical protein